MNAPLLLAMTAALGLAAGFRTVCHHLRVARLYYAGRIQTDDCVLCGKRQPDPLKDFCNDCYRG